MAREKKGLALTYALWALSLVGICGVQRMYLGQTGLGIALLFTFGFCGVGQFFDLLLLPNAVKQANQRLRDSNMVLPTNRQREANKAFGYFRDGMNAQADGRYLEALENYKEALRFEDNPNEKSSILYNMALVFASNGDYAKALDFYAQALELNSKMPQALNNMAVIHHHLGSIAEESGDADEADHCFNQAADFWGKTIRLAPNNYIEAQNWLKECGRGRVDLVNQTTQHTVLSGSEAAGPNESLMSHSISQAPSTTSTLASSGEEDELDQLLRHAEDSVNRIKISDSVKDHDRG